MWGILDVEISKFVYSSISSQSSGLNEIEKQLGTCEDMHLWGLS